MTSRLYRIIEHTADTGFEVRGATKEQVFAAAAEAFFRIMWQIEAPRLGEPETIEVRGSDLEELLVNFLEEFLYIYEAKGLVCTGVEIEGLKAGMVRARAWLQKFDPTADQELLSVKAVTYHQLFIGKKNNTWLAQVFLDI